VAYGDHERNRYDVYYPEGEAPEGGWPVVVFYHGGAFVKGDKARYQLRPALTGVRRGYAVASVQYRLAPADSVIDAFADARNAVRHMAAHAGKLGLDAGRMVVWGESAGAELACYTGLVDECSLVDGSDAAPMPALRGVVDWYAPIDVLAWNRELRADGRYRDEEGHTLLEQLCGIAGEEFLSKAALLDPTNFLREGVCPVLIEHGAADVLVTPQQSIRFREELLRWLPEEDVPFRLVEGAVHGIADYENEENLDWVFSFIDRCMA